MVPPLQQARLYKGPRLIKDSIDSYCAHPTPHLLTDIHAQAPMPLLHGTHNLNGDTASADVTALRSALV